MILRTWLLIENQVQPHASEGQHVSGSGPVPGPFLGHQFVTLALELHEGEGMTSVFQIGKLSF